MLTFQGQISRGFYVNYYLYGKGLPTASNKFKQDNEYAHDNKSNRNIFGSQHGPCT
jgi:hypothetical protein